MTEPVDPKWVAKRQLRRDRAQHRAIVRKLVGRTVERVVLRESVDVEDVAGFDPVIYFTDGSCLTFHARELTYTDPAVLMTLNEPKRRTRK